jgi:hypothetical protein
VSELDDAHVGLVLGVVGDNVALERLLLDAVLLLLPLLSKLAQHRDAPPLDGRHRNVLLLDLALPQRLHALLRGIPGVRVLGLCGCRLK